MSQFGMQSPAARMKRGPSVDIYAAMMALAVIFLGAACFVLWPAASKVGKNGNFWELQEKGKVELKAVAGK